MPKPNVDTMNGAFVAKAISITCCEHGSVWIRLHDRADNVFAAGCVDRGTALGLEGQLHRAIIGIGGIRCDIIH